MMVSSNSNFKFGYVIVLLMFSLLMEYAILFNHLNPNIKAASGTPSLSFSIAPGTVSPGQNFDLRLNVNPNNAIFNAFELYINYDPTVVEFQNTSNLSLNIGSAYPLIVASVDTTNNLISIVGTKSGAGFTGTTNIMLALVKMRVKSNASGTMNFYWNPNTNLGQRLTKDMIDGFFPIAGGGGSPDLHIDTSSVITLPGQPAELQRGQSLDVEVLLKSAGRQVKSFDFVFPYDDSRLTFPNTADLTQNIEINPASGFYTQFAVKKVDTAAKKIFISMVVPIVNQNPVPVSSQSDILLATIKFVVKPAAPLGNFDLLPDKSSLIFNLQDQNILSCVGGIHFAVGQSTVTPPPSPTPSQNSAGLTFMLKFPDIASTNISGSDVQIELRDGTNAVGIANIDLVRNGSYFQTAFEIVFTIPQNKAYTVIVKTTTSLRRIFSGVNLTRGTTLDCTVTSNLNCGELISQRDSKLMLTGDSDGFDTASGSYNKVDSADLSVLATYYNQAASGGGAAADFNYDSRVDIGDLEILGRNYSQSGD